MDAFNLTARLRLDTSEYDEALGRVRENLPRLGDESEETGQRGEQAAHRMGAAFKTVAVAVGAAVSAAAAGAGALVKQSVDAYANYEQLVGGVETLFSNLEGTVSAAPTVLENASNAYKTAGMSANEYMETVTSFSAALVSSLGNDYQKAAEISDMAIRDMSDNANKMGTSMEAIQNAYQGFSKQNYTMLDNLKLGYGGTKTEMERLVADAEKLNSSFRAQRDENGKLTLSLDDVYNAIHIMQQEMGIAGTTAKEAGDTISGSFGSLSAAWENLITGFADKSADLPALIDNVVTAAEGSFKNLMPVAEQAISGVANFVEDIAPVITEKIPGLVDEILPPLLSTANTVVNSLVTSLPPILSGIVEVVPSVVTDITDTFIQELPQIVDLGADLVISLANGITEALPELIPAATSAITEIAQTLTDPDRLSELLEAGVNMIGAILEGVVQAVPQLVNAAIDAAGNLLSALPGLQGFGEFLKEHKELVEAAAAAWVVYKAATAIGNVVSAATTAISGLVTAIQAQITALSGATAAQTALNVVMAAAPFAGLAVAVTAVATEFTFFYKEIFEVSDAIKELQKTQSDLEATIATGHTSRDVELNQLQLKADRYEELRKVENRTAGQENELKTLAGELQSVLGDDVQVINQVTGAYNDVSNAVDNYIEAMKREAKVNAYKETLTEIYKEIAKAEEQLEKRADEHAKTNWGFWQSIETTNFINEQNATRDIIRNYESDIDRIMQGIGDVYEEASNDIDNIYTKSTTLAQDLANQRLASYAPAKFIPTEAARQMAGVAAIPIKEFGEEMNNSLEETGAAIEKGIKTTSKAANDFIDAGFGNYKNLGIVQMLGHTFTEAEKVIDDKAKAVYQYQTKAVENQVTLGKMTLQEQIAAYKTIQGQFVEGSEQYLDAEKKIFSLQKQLDKEQEDAEKESLEKRKQAWEDYSQRVQDINAQIADIQANYDNEVKSRASEIASTYSLFEEVPKRVAMSGKTLISNLEGQVDRMKLFYDDLGKLAGKGVSEGLVQAIRDMGPAALDELEAVLDMDEADLAKYNKTFEMKLDLSSTVATQELEPLKQETESKIAEMYGEIGTLTAENALSIGTSFMEGIGTAIADNAETVAEQAKEAVSKSWQEAFGTSDTSSVGTIAPELTSNMTVNNENHFTFNVNGIQYQSVTALAKAISNELQFLTNRRAAGYAGA